MIDMVKILESIKRHRDALAEIGKLNKQTIFDSLRESHIEKVIVVFDGEGDSGQIESIIAYKSDTETPLPTPTVTLKAVDWNGDSQPDAAFPLPEAVERLCYDFLEQEHGGWENNDGAFGEFILNVIERTVSLDFNGRYSDVHTTSHTF